MTTDEDLPAHILKLVENGEHLRDQAVNLLDQWPLTADSKRFLYDELQSPLKVRVDDLRKSIRKWYNLLSTSVLPYTIYTKESLFQSMQTVLGTFRDPERIGDVQQARSDVKTEIDWALNVIGSLPSVPPLPNETRHNSFASNTAFIMMWMDPMVPELDDVSNVIKDVCARFAIKAIRSDDVEHQDKITDVVLQHIANSEFLIADMTGERPNVYYEVGYAHAMSKRPILYRRKGTKLHFDLSVHNVPEYKNLTELKELLTKRLGAILGRAPD